MSQLPNKQRHLITVTNPRSPVSEAFRALRTNIDFSSVDETIQVIMVTSSGPEEGKSTVSANLAAAYAQADKKVLLIDGDLRKPTAHKTFSLSNRFGLSSLLSQQAVLEDTVQDSGVSNLSIMTSGPIPPNPAEMMASNRMSTLCRTCASVMMSFLLILHRYWQLQMRRSWLPRVMVSLWLSAMAR